MVNISFLHQFSYTFGNFFPSAETADFVKTQFFSQKVFSLVTSLFFLVLLGWFSCLPVPLVEGASPEGTFPGGP